ncbi:FAD dependent oxidoreductase [Gymnopus androsaceus JB14]|uniref:FAD dependent oxidoreductase n=1 Tax=Gymnopus androsaceus JB14 TaxID=1447944 RepID=A0A6A4HF26_9AGAR|nr:FAD dependent oxidoreductase [Gymnopus androsaceus JB14]
MYYEADEANSYHSPGLPVQEPCLSFWLQGTRSSTLLGHRTTESLPQATEVAIIGSGLSGVATAYFLFNGPNPPKSVVILEAREACDGATGRNGGYSSYKRALERHPQDNFNLTMDLIEKEDIECDFWKGDTLDTALDKSSAELRRKSYEEFKADGGPVDSIVMITDSDEAKRISRMRNAVLTAIFPGASLWPYKLVAHLLKLCIDKFGLNLQTTTPVTSVKPGTSSGWILETPRGNITAEKVVYATNAYTATLLPEFLGCIVPGQGQCAAIVPTKSFSGKGMLAHTCCYRFGDGNYDYLIQRPQDGIIILGGGKWNVERMKIAGETNDSMKQPEITEYLKGAMASHYEGWGTERPGEGYLYDWTGIMGYTRENIPFPSAYVNAGHCGHGKLSELLSSIWFNRLPLGMARIVSCSKGIATLIAGGSWEETKLPECYQPSAKRLNKENK